jgi:hypothetical protein
MATQKQRDFVLRCLAYPGLNGDERGYYAVCIDVNLFTWRPSLKEAKTSLNDAIKGYLETVADLSKGEALSNREIRNRIMRPAAFWPHKVRYYAFSLLEGVSRKTRSAYRRPVNISALGAMA